MWVIEKYVKYLIGFAILWAIIWAQRTYSCSAAENDQMAPVIPKDAFIYFKPMDGEFKEEERGKTLIFYESLPVHPSILEKRFVARLIGLPGDRVAFLNGHLRRNGEVVGEEYLREGMTGAGDLPEITVPRGHVYVLADNRPMSAFDSRLLGPISIHSILGRARGLFK